MLCLFTVAIGVAVLLLTCHGDTATNAPIPLISTNAPDPAKALDEARAIGFDIGVTYGALAARRNPDLYDATALRAVARQLLAADQRRQGAAKP